MAARQGWLSAVRRRQLIRAVCQAKLAFSSLFACIVSDFFAISNWLHSILSSKIVNIYQNHVDFVCLRHHVPWKSFRLFFPLFGFAIVIVGFRASF